MIKPSSFDNRLYSKLKLIAHIQKELVKLNLTNINEIGEEIKKEKEIWETSEGVYILVQTLIDFAEYRPKNIEIFSDLFIYLQQLSSESSKIFHLEEYFVSFINSRSPISLSYLFFLRTLFSKKSIPFDLILLEIKKTFSKTKRNNYCCKSGI